MALRTKERARVAKENAKKSSVDSKEQGVKECSNNNSRVLDERKPLLEESKEKYKAMDMSNAKEKQRKKRNDEAVNTPILVNKNKRQKEEEKVSQIRTYPPSPQCFSVKRGATKARTPKAFRSRPQERGILQELKQTNKDIRKEQPADKGTHGKNVPIAAEREARTMDLFWV